MSASNKKGCFEVGRGPVRFDFDPVVLRSAGWLGRVGRVGRVVFSCSVYVMVYSPGQNSERVQSPWFRGEAWNSIQQ